MQLFQNDILELARKGDSNAIQALNERGFIIASTESLDQYCDRLNRLEEQYEKLNNDLQNQGFIELEGIRFKVEDKIDESLFHKSLEENKERYGINVDWVPGFFYSPGALFGGCAWGIPPDFLTLFILRPSFQHKEKWYIYGRQELMSHELCHAARFPLQADKYEELLAYQTSTSKFRKLFGPMVRSAKETYVLMGIIFALFASQIWVFNQPYVEPKFLLPTPILILTLALIAYFAFLMIRQWNQNRIFQIILAKLSKITDRPKHLVFRLDDREMDEVYRAQKFDKEIFIKILYTFFYD